MIYIKVRWFHDFNPKYQQSKQDSIEIYHELDDDRNELKRIEIFANGAIAYKVKKENIDDGLSLEPIPSLDFINNQEEFEAINITPNEFENKWRLRDRG